MLSLSRAERVALRRTLVIVGLAALAILGLR